MNNCLVTKLKSSVNNDDLLKLGEMRIKVKKNSNLTTPKQQSIKFQANGGQIAVYTTGPGYFVTYSEDKLNNVDEHMTYIDIPSNLGSITLFFANDDYEIRILNKYEMTSLEFNSANNAYNMSLFELDLNDAEYLTNLHNLKINYSYSTGDIKSLKNLDIHKLKIDNCPNIYGNINDLNILSLVTFNASDNIYVNLNAFDANTKLVELTTNPDKCFGNIDTYVANQRIAGRKEMTLDNPLYLWGIVNSLWFGSEKINVPNNSAFITWTESKIVIYCNVFNNPASAPIIYATGVTDEEVAAWENEEKTVYIH